MVAAYDSQGRLKKHALLGTSLAVDPNRAAQRQQFEDLYGEAKAAAAQGVGRAGFLDRLSSRYGAEEQRQHQSLNDLASRSQGFVAEAQKLRDFEKEDELRERAAKFRDMTSGLKGATSSKDLQFNKIRRMAKPLVHEGVKKWRRMTDQAKGEYRLEHGRGQYAFIKDYVLGGEKRAKDEFAAYEANINQEVDRINQSLIPVQQEYADRQQRLADRVELYNLFLGA